MSHHLTNTGSYIDRNELYLQLPSELQKLYRDVNWRGVTLPDKVCEVNCLGKYDGVFMPGVFLRDASDGTQLFQFLHLHPMWLATFASLGGEFLRPYAPVFFALISILFFAMLMWKMTQNQFYTTTFALFFCCYPAHVYFSKFPVSEMVGLGFISMFFYYLYLTLEANHTVKRKASIIAAASLGCYFFVHVSGIFYLPVICLLLLNAIADEDAIRRRSVYLFVSLILLIFLLSVCYGLYTSAPYVLRIYQPITNRMTLIAMVAV